MRASASMPYARRELWLLIGLAAVLLAGIGVREWRAGFPALAERLALLAREEPVEPLPAAPREPRPPRRAARLPDAGEAPAASAPSLPPPRTAGATAAPPPRAAGIPAPEPDPRPLDLNAASLEQIARLPGVGSSLALRIVEERERRGRFESPEALRGILGLGPKKLAALRDLVTVVASAEE